MNNSGTINTSPYQEAFSFATRGIGTSGSQAGMIKLLLSLEDHGMAFSFAECVREFDSERRAMAQALIAHYLNVGIDRELENIYIQLARKYPHFIALGDAGYEAKMKYRDSAA